MKAIIQIGIDEEKKDLVVTYLDNSTPFDKTAHLSARTKFIVEFSDYPNQLREAGWK